MEGGDDGRPTSMGVSGLLGPRNAPTVWNSVFQHSQFWDGRAATLEEQSIGPIVAAPEMGMPSHDVAIQRLSAIDGYVQEFAKVFKSSDAVTIDNVGKAIAAFERTLITPNSVFDKYVSGDASALTSQQLRGMERFDSVGCTECHSGPNFNSWTGDESDMIYEEFPRYSDSPLVKQHKLDLDLGRFNATNDDADKHFFKIALLRNITLTGPYFHNGAVDTLGDAVRIMAKTQLDEELSDGEVDDIVSFLSALEGEFPEIVLPRLPSRSGRSILENQTAASDVGNNDTETL
ncbi:UNVERIFIED_CONTAM: hypothetical protein GTU68_028201 [Idotea baltica]|nr:hypothetical protein [Idotea baltica]